MPLPDGYCTGSYTKKQLSLHAPYRDFQSVDYKSSISVETISVLAAWERSTASPNCRVPGKELKKDYEEPKRNQMARTIGPLFSLQQTRANICGIKL